MYLAIQPNGSKYRRMKYRIGGKAKRLSFGVHPEVRPPETREKAKAARDPIRAYTARPKNRRPASVTQSLCKPGQESAGIDVTKTIAFESRCLFNSDGPCARSSG